MPRRIQLKRTMPWSMLAAVSMVAASLVIIAQPATPALAATNQFKGVNWADTRDNYNTGWVIPDGLSSSDTYSQVYTVANDTIEAFKSDLGANTVRLPINIPSVSQSWWSSYRAATDAALADGMKVILSYWTQSSSTGTITDMSGWTSMWSTVVSDYGSNSNVYFEPMNEPFGYSASQWESIASTWLSDFSSVPRSRVIISGTGYNDNVTGVGADSALAGTLLSLHFYPTWASYTDEADWTSDLTGRIGSYTGRTIIDEFGAPMTTGIDYLTDHNSQLNQAYLAAVTDTARSDSMGSVDWAGLKGGDSFSMTERSGTGLTVNDESGLEQVQWGWGD